jgi:catechol-2,3-dioxygenase
LIKWFGGKIFIPFGGKGSRLGQGWTEESGRGLRLSCPPNDISYLLAAPPRTREFLGCSQPAFLLSIRIITTEVKRLVQFYQQVTGMPVVQYTEDLAELKTKTATLAIGSTRTLQLFRGDHVAKAAQKNSAHIQRHAAEKSFL